MIRCAAVVFDYPDGTRALDGVSLEIQSGERVAIMGRNGSGKTTLVRLWNGLLRPTAGRVEIDGRAAEGRRVAELATIVSMTFQEPDRQLFARSCRQEVEFGPRNLGLRGQALDQAIEAALEATGLAPRARANPYDLGPSTRRLLAIASALSMGTPVVVLDEPTMGLDGRQIGLVEQIVADLGAAGRTVVAISHDARFVAGSFDRVLRLDAGRVVADEAVAR